MPAAAVTSVKVTPPAASRLPSRSAGTQRSAQDHPRARGPDQRPCRAPSGSRPRTSVAAATGRQCHRFVIVDRLPLVVVFRADQPPRSPVIACDDSSALNRRNSCSSRAASRLVAQPAVAEHRRVVHLQSSGSTAGDLLEHVERVRVLRSRNRMRADLVQHDAVARILAAATVRATRAPRRSRRRPSRSCALKKWIRPSFGSIFSAFVDVTASRLGLPFLDQRARDVQPAVGISGSASVTLRNAYSAPFRSPCSSRPMPQSFHRSRSCFSRPASTAVRFGVAERQRRLRLRKRHDRQVGTRP